VKLKAKNILIAFGTLIGATTFFTLMAMATAPVPVQAIDPMTQGNTVEYTDQPPTIADRVIQAHYLANSYTWAVSETRNLASPLYAFPWQQANYQEYICWWCQSEMFNSLLAPNEISAINASLPPTIRAGQVRDPILGTECDSTYAEPTCPVNALRSSPTRFIRLADVHWTTATQPVAGQFTLTSIISQYLPGAKTAYADGINPIMIIRDSPDWASAAITDANGNNHHYKCQPPTPAHYQDFANFVTQVITVFYPYITYYEIWNEPDLSRALIDGNHPEKGDSGYTGCFGSNPISGNSDASGGISYTNMMKVVYPAVKAIWPNVTLIGPAIAESPSNDPFLTGAISAGLESYIDIVSYHAYEYTWEPGGVPNSHFQYLGLVSKLITPTTPVMLTEGGWVTYTYPVPAQVRITQSLYLSSSYQYAVTDSLGITNPLVGYIWWRAEPGGGFGTELFDTYTITSTGVISLRPNLIYTTYLSLQPAP
jgi:hypothetical protein